MSARAWPWLSSVGLLALMLWPAIRNEDGFPLSNYPMFSNNRPRRVTVFHVVGFDSQDRGMPLPPRFLGTDEIMQAFQTARLATQAGPARAHAFCEQVGTHVRTRAEKPWVHLQRLELRSDTFDAVDYWQGNRTLLASHVFARCPVVAREDAA